MRPFPDHRPPAIRFPSALIAIAAALAASAGARAQTISNVASATFGTPGAVQTVASNRVDLVVTRMPAPPPGIVTYELVPPDRGGNGPMIGAKPSICRGVTGDVPYTLPAIFGASATLGDTQRTTAIKAGRPLVLGIASATDNRSATAIDTLEAVLRPASGDEEVVVMRETGIDTGVFVGLIDTAASPPAPIRRNCALSLGDGEPVNLIVSRVDDGSILGRVDLTLLIDPFGIVFDSADGTPVSGARVTVVDAATGQPATVFGDNGRARYPSTMLTGSPVTDSEGMVYPMPPGEFRFPLMAPGSYRLVIEPPAPYRAPSVVPPALLAKLRRSDGGVLRLVDASYSGSFTLATPDAVRIDVPLDRPGKGVTIRKTASLAIAAPGAVIQYRIAVTNGDATRPSAPVTVRDVLPPTMRLKPDTVRIGGIKAAYVADGAGRIVTLAVPPIVAAGQVDITYLLEVRPDAADGDSMNSATATDSFGTTTTRSDAVVRIVRDAISERLTIVGRITDGACTVDPARAHPLAGVRVMLEDGSYAVTDIDGRYHFEGVVPGLHVVQVDPGTFGPDLVPASCGLTARDAHNPLSRFVDGQGGGLYRVDFRAQPGRNAVRAAPAATRPAAASDSDAAGGTRDYLVGLTPGIGWVFPAGDYNPRTRAIRVAVQHAPGQKVALFTDGAPVNPMTLDGSRPNATGDTAVTVWRAVAIGDRDTVMKAVVTNPDGTVAGTITRTVHFAQGALRATLVRDRSVLIADGVTRPVVALRLVDRDGRPIHHGLVGDFSVPAPYFPAVEADAQATRQLAGLERARPVWRVDGDDGIAYIELEPTTASGSLSITLPLRDGEVTRTQRIDAWLTPGNRPWTIVGLAAGTVGFDTLRRNLEAPGTGNPAIHDGRVALYAKGRVRGKWLLTMAYDSAKREAAQRFGGVIDPLAYYTVYADRSERRYDAQSIRKLYLRIERPQFFALFGDFDSGLAEPQLTRYVRALNGVKAQYQSSRVAATAFAADTPFTHRRDELQGNGLSGLYALRARNIVPNSETIVIEVRDRLRSDRIVSRDVLTRYIDYDLDYATGTLRFRSPILSRASSLDPQFIIANYEVDGVAGRSVNAGGRATWVNAAATLGVGATALHEADGDQVTDLGGVDIRYAPTTTTEVRAELAGSRGRGRGGNATGDRDGLAWLVEAEHHGRTLDLLAYARQQDLGYGVGQTNAVEAGARKIGGDARIRLTKRLSVTASAWVQRELVTGAARTAGQAKVDYRGDRTDLRAGVLFADDTLRDGRRARSTLLQLGATQRFFDKRLELDVQSEFAVGTRDDSIDLPTRHLATARVAVTRDVTLIGSYEVAKSPVIDSRTARLGFDIKPWAGAHLIASANRQSIAEYGPRSFAAFGLSQSLPIGKHWSIDATLDANRTLGGFDPARVLNPLQPVATGGFIGSGATLTEDFTAVTLGATYRGDRWSWASRAEYRHGDQSRRWGVTSSLLRQFGEGRALGGQLTWFEATTPTGIATQTGDLALSWAHRPASNRWSVFDKVELHHDAITGGIAGQLGPIGGAPLLTGDARSRRALNSLSVNWSPVAGDREHRRGVGEVALFWGTRYVSDRIDADDIKGWSNVVAADARWDLSTTLDIGVAGSVRQSIGGGATSFSGGPVVGIAPFKNGYVSLGYNISGYRDRDFADARYTRSGFYLTLRLKVDQTSFAGLGLDPRR